MPYFFMSTKIDNLSIIIVISIFLVSDSVFDTVQLRISIFSDNLQIINIFHLISIVFKISAKSTKISDLLALNCTPNLDWSV